MAYVTDEQARAWLRDQPLELLKAMVAAEEARVASELVSQNGGGRKMNQLFIVEHEDGEMLDFNGDGGFSVFVTEAEARDALDSVEDSRADNREGYSVVRFVRDYAQTPAPQAGKGVAE